MESFFIKAVAATESAKLRIVRGLHEWRGLKSYMCRLGCVGL